MLSLRSNLSHWADRVIFRAGFVLHIASGFVMVIMGLLITYGVVRRYIFDSPEPYSYEYTSYLLMTCMLISAVHITSLDRHIRADLLTCKFPKKVQHLLSNLISPIAGCFFCGIVTWKSWELACRSMQTGITSTSGMPIFIVQMVVPISTGLICLILLSKIGGYLFSGNHKYQNINKPS